MTLSPLLFSPSRSLHSIIRLASLASSYMYSKGRWNRETWQRGTKSEIEQKGPLQQRTCLLSVRPMKRGQAAAKSHGMHLSVSRPCRHLQFLRAVSHSVGATESLQATAACRQQQQQRGWGRSQSGARASSDDVSSVGISNGASSTSLWLLYWAILLIFF